jgi:serine/threonine protein kinase
MGGQFSEKSDIWSLGAVLLHIATGWRPWAHLKSEYAIIYHLTILKEPLSVPVNLKDKVGENIYNIIRSCLQYDPSLRPTARALLTLLKD